MAKLRYVGKKEWKDDNIGGTAAIWNGAGDIQEVPDEKLELYLAHPDVWELVAEKAPAKTKKQVVAPAVKKPVEEEEEDHTNVRVDVDTMTKAEIVAFAKRTFNADLDASKTAVELCAAAKKLLGIHRPHGRKARG